MWIARDRNIVTYPGEPWGLDNGAFRDWKHRRPFDGDVFRRVIDKALAQSTPPILAVVPDSPGDATTTMRMLESWLPTLPSALPWYVAVQDGMEPTDIDGYPICGVFLGGTNGYKARARDWCDWAHDKGLPFHFGRCGTQEKLALAMSIGADSVDSAFPMWTMGRLRFFTSCVTHGVPQMDLFL